MKKSDLSRRDFNRLTVAAFGGVVAGTLAGCGGGGDDPAPADPGETPETNGTEGEAAAGTEGEAAERGAEEVADLNVCRGLNACKGKGAGGANDCAGMGACATAAAHECAGKNECKGQGGCGEILGSNECKGKGKCAVPLSDQHWTKARAGFEKAMTEAGKTFGDAPAKG